MLNPDFKEFVKLLIKNQVEYLVVGGYAVSIHGYPRYTGDLDVWINPTPQNASLVVQTIDDFGFSSFELKDEDFTKQYGIIQLGYPPVRIDIINTIDGVGFTECYARKAVFDIDGLKINFINFEDLIKNKKTTARPRDIDDIENLTK